MPDEVKSHILSWKEEIDKIVNDIDAWEANSFVPAETEQEVNDAN